jgi:hypothetical protein
VQPLKPLEHWHIDVSHLNIAGTFYFLCSILDGCSRFIVHHEIRDKMEEIDVEIIVQRAREKFPGEHPRRISDNGPQFIAKDFKEFIRQAGMTHVKTSPYYPKSNGKMERGYKTLKGDCIRVKVPLALDEARRITLEYVEHYNAVRLHSAIGYVTPYDRLHGRHEAIFAQRDRKLVEARERRKDARQPEHNKRPCHTPVTERPAIDFGAIRDAVSMAAPSACSASSHAPPTAPNSAALVPCTDRPMEPAAASPSTPATTSSTASNAAAPATPWTFGHRPTDKRLTTPPSNCANASTSRCPSWLQQPPRTGKRKP